MLPRYLALLLVYDSVGRQNRRTAELVRLAGKIADLSARFLYEQDTGGGIPFLQAELPEAVEAPRSHAREIESGGAIAAPTVGAQGEVPVVMNVGVVQALVHRKAGAKQDRRNRGYL